MAEEGYKTVITKDTFRGNQKIVNVNLNGRPVKDSDLSYGFADCVKLQTCERITNIANLNYCFYNCTSLTEAPLVGFYGCTSAVGTFKNCVNLTDFSFAFSETVTDLTDCFNGCTNLTTSRVLNYDSRVKTLTRTFKDTAISSIDTLERATECDDMEEVACNCQNMQTINKLPPVVKNLKRAFYNCKKLANLECNIPDTVTNMKETFYNCPLNETKCITISSQNVEEAKDCFFIESSKEADKILEVPMNSLTYMTFKSEGYSETERKNGILLVPYMYICYYIQLLQDSKPLPDDIAKKAKVTITYEGKTYNCKPTINAHSNGRCNSGSCSYSKFFLVTPTNIGITYTVEIPGYETVTGSHLSVGKETLLNVPVVEKKSTFNLRVVGYDPDIIRKIYLYANGSLVAETSNALNVRYEANANQSLQMSWVIMAEGYEDTSGSVTWNTNNDSERIVSYLTRKTTSTFTLSIVGYPASIIQTITLEITRQAYFAGGTPEILRTVTEHNTLTASCTMTTGQHLNVSWSIIADGFSTTTGELTWNTSSDRTENVYFLRPKIVLA